MKKRLLWWFVLLAFPMCQTPSSEQVSMNNYESDDIPKLQQAAYNGNVEAYQRLRIIALDFSPGTEFLYDALMMANKNYYPPAYLDVYHDIYKECEMNGARSFHDLDKETQALLRHYLTKAAAKGMHEADTILLEIKKGPPVQPAESNM
ncbi:hypothetical protein [Hymenobacter yonginensis]|uniref:Sel1 repeat family protein n=1 Tax=Hymenobacter yonginensis TaxID=748197 RepID=A0ABY7PUY4_9BACT|nr:hypothetical protein [Hymenobacter yonginensis]WBO86725.1 hypothetical protein O9Z63_20810 [Hymenobacter yonginensis]